MSDAEFKPVSNPAGPGLPPMPQRASFGSGIRTWFFTGLVVAGPLALTLWLVFWFIDTVDQWVKPLIPPTLWPDTYLPVRLPGTGVVLAFLALTLLGFLAANLAGRTLIRFGETLLDRMPVVRSVYKTFKQIFETMFSKSGTNFRKVGLVEYPGRGMWSIVFISADPGAPVASALPGQGYTSVFLPCAPNPTTGFYFYLPSADVIPLTLSPEEAFKVIMSGGLIQPETSPAILEAMRAEHQALVADKVETDTASV